MNHLKVQAIKNLVTSQTGLDLNSRYKTDALVKARAICYKILRDECLMSYKYIGDNFGKNHATIIHACKEFKWMLQSDRSMERMYHTVLSLWKEEAQDYIELKPAELKKELKDLAEQNKMLNLSLINVQEQCEEIRRYTSKYSNIVNLIEGRNLPEQKLKEVETKLNHVLNGL
jgi:hypothetical protein